MNDLEFIEESHQYLYKGVLIPCVSEIIGFKFPNTYEGIPKHILAKKAEYGTKTHEIVEKVLMEKMTLDEVNNMNINPTIKVSAQLAKELCRKWFLKPKAVEQKVCYKGKYAGTFDFITEDDFITDIKTTSSLHIDNETLQAPLNLQISLYYMAAGIKKDYGYVLWLPKNGDAKIQQVNCWNWNDLKELVKEYEKSKKQSYKYKS